jgi:hypothetical protein
MYNALVRTTAELLVISMYICGSMFCKHTVQYVNTTHHTLHEKEPHTSNLANVIGNVTCVPKRSEHTSNRANVISYWK